jgi:hypothetical protein
MLYVPGFSNHLELPPLVEKSWLLLKTPELEVWLNGRTFI